MNLQTIQTIILLFDGVIMLAPWRMGAARFGRMLFEFFPGLTVWGGLRLRDRWPRALMPLRG